ncbi:MAG: TRAM domain-containing protein, partial [Hyphomonas sp.]|nr:TRAM domain-containing protein [Hyphomonas sp.]
PDIALATDFIVGFPGESDADFEATMQLARDVGYAIAYSFKYSARPGTPATGMHGHLSEEVKDARLQALQSLLRDQQTAFNKSCIGRTIPVLVTGKGRNPGQMHGRSPYLQAVHFEGTEAQLGTLVDVQILSASLNSLSGDLVRVRESAA